MQIWGSFHLYHSVIHYFGRATCILIIKTNFKFIPELKCQNFSVNLVAMNSNILSFLYLGTQISIVVKYLFINP